MQASIQGDFIRVASKDRDTLQMAIKLLRESDFGIDMQFITIDQARFRAASVRERTLC